MAASLLKEWPHRLRDLWLSPAFERFASGWPAGLLLVVLCLAVYLPGLATIPAVDRDESRFAQASRQMFESVALPEAQRDTRPFEIHESPDGTSSVTVGLHAGGLAVPAVGERPRLNKPPLIYWLQAASSALFTQGDPLRDAIWMYRVPSLLAAILAVLATWRIGASMSDPRVGLLAAAFLAVCPVVAWESHQARADHALLATTTLTMWCLWELFKRRTTPRDQRSRSLRWTGPLALATALALGILAKGPITPLIAGLTLIALCLLSRNWRWTGTLKLWLTVLVCAALVAPWVWAVGERVGHQRYLAIVLDETLGRSAGAKEGHWGPPGYHTVLSAVLFWPGSLLTLAAVTEACRRAIRLRESSATGLRRSLSLPARMRARSPETDAPLFLLCWLLPAWLVFELVSTKLPHYTLPLYPALALLTALTLHRLIREGLMPDESRKLRGGILIWSAIGLAVCLAPPIALLAHGLTTPTAIAGAAVAIAAGLVLVTGAALLAFRARPLAAHALAIGAWTIAIACTLGLALPRASDLWTTRALVARLDLYAADWRAQPIGAVRYHEDSLVFASRGRLARLPDHAGPAWLDANPSAVLIAPADLDIPGAHRLTADPIRGLNYAAGRTESLHLWTNTPPQTRVGDPNANVGGE